MQESTELTLYKRGSRLVGQSIILALSVIICCLIGYIVSERELTYKTMNMEIGTIFENYQAKIDLQENKRREKEYKDNLARIELEKETTKKVVKMAGVTYVSTKKDNTTNTAVTSVNNDSYTAPEEYKEVIEVKATAYCLCKKCCGKSEDNPRYGVTSSGIKIIPGTGMKVIAVDPNIIPLKSKVYVEGLNGAADYGYAVAADTGSAIKNNKIDLYFDSHQDALKWGKKSVRVYVIE